MNILGIVPALIPSVNMGIINPMQLLQKKGKINFKVTLPYLFKSKMLENIDCVIFCRNSMPNEEWILNEVIQKKIPYIYEIDDNFFEIPYDNVLGRVHRHPINLSSLINFISHASVVRTYSHLLAEDAGFYNKNVEMNRVYFDFELLKELKQNKSAKLKIIYATSRMADSQQDIFTEALYKIALNYKDNIEIYFWGAPIVDKELRILSNVFHLAPIYNYEKFIKKFYEMGFDIGLAPIFEGRFFNSKTNNKYREYGACKIAGIYSNEDLYSDCVVDGKNGLLVKNTAENWYFAIEKLINDEKLRNNIICSANSDIKKNYSFEYYCDVWLYSIHKAISNKLEVSKLISYYRKDSHINLFIIKDFKLKSKKLQQILQKIQNLYSGSKVGIVSITEFEFEIDEVFRLDVLFKNNGNIIFISDNIEFIKYINNYSKYNKINPILLTTLEYLDCEQFKNIHFISIKDEYLNIFENHRKNIYLKIDYIIKKVFEQNQELSSMKKIRYSIIRRIVNNKIIRKILFIIEKKNSIKLRFYTWWKIYRINRGK